MIIINIIIINREACQTDAAKTPNSNYQSCKLQPHGQWHVSYLNYWINSLYIFLKNHHNA